MWKKDFDCEENSIDCDVTHVRDDEHRIEAHKKLVNGQDNTIDKIMNGGNDTRVRDDEHGIEAHKEIVTMRTNLK